MADNENIDGFHPPTAGCHTCDEPLVATLEFPGFEFICVVCGRKYEYLSPKRLQTTPERDARHEELRAQYQRERAEREAESQ